MEDHSQLIRQRLLSDGEEELLTLTELAESSELSLSLLEVLAREGLLVPRVESPDQLFHAGDAEAVKAGLEMIGAGLPLAELLEVARRADDALRPVADAAVDTFIRFVSDPVSGTASSPEEAETRLVKALETMLPAAGRLIAHHFERLLIDGARKRLDS